MLFGAHLSTAGGLETAFDRADEERCDAFQIFTKNKGAWAAKALTDEQVRGFRARAATSRARPVVAHSAYLINIASPSTDLFGKSVDALRIELERCEALGIDYLVLHPGSHGATSEDAGLRRVTKALDSIHRATKGFTSKILLENAAGQGSAVCAPLSSIGKVFRGVKEPERLGVCIDTCHLFAAGYDLRTPDGYGATIDELEREFGAQNVRCIHANDSKKELGTRVDRHEHIGRGCIGAAGMKRVVNDPRFSHAPFIFELPPEDGMIGVNLKILRGFLASPRAGSKTKKTAVK
jgi:deoxyribonuclease-4